MDLANDIKRVFALVKEQMDKYKAKEQVGGNQLKTSSARDKYLSFLSPWYKYVLIIVCSPLSWTYNNRNLESEYKETLKPLQFSEISMIDPASTKSEYLHHYKSQITTGKQTN